MANKLFGYKDPHDVIFDKQTGQCRPVGWGPWHQRAKPKEWRWQKSKRYGCGKRNAVMNAFNLEPSRTLESIAQEVGVTRERVRQIIKDSTSLSKSYFNNVWRAPKLWEKRIVSNFMAAQKYVTLHALRLEAKTVGLQTRSIIKKGRVCKNLFKLGERICLFRRGSYCTHQGRASGRLCRPRPATLDRNKVEFVIYKIGGKHWMVVPREAVERMPRMVIFALEPKNKYLGWRKYLSAWDLLK